MSIRFPHKVLITGPSLELQGGVAHFVDLLLKATDSSHVKFIHMVVGKYSESSGNWKRPFEYFIQTCRFIVALFRERPDLVHLNPSLTYRSLPLSLTLILIARLLKQRVVIMFHGWDQEVATSLIAGGLRGRLLEKSLFGADRYLVLAKQFKDQLVQAGFPSNKVSVTSMMVDSGHFNLNVIAPDQKPSQSLHILFLSRLECDKGVWELIEAVEWWQQNYGDLRLQVTIAGDGSQKHALEHFATEKGLSSMIRFTGYVRGQNKLNLFRDAQIFVFPSCHQEGFPNAILEALAAGLPIIYTPIGACAEILGSENGIRIEVNDLSGKTLAEALRTLYLDPIRRHCMSTANRRLADERYNSRRVANSFTTLYQNIILHNEER